MQAVLAVHLPPHLQQQAQQQAAGYRLYPSLLFTHKNPALSADISSMGGIFSFYTLSFETASGGKPHGWQMKLPGQVSCNAVKHACAAARSANTANTDEPLPVI